MRGVSQVGCLGTGPPLLHHPKTGRVRELWVVRRRQCQVPPPSSLLACHTVQARDNLMVSGFLLVEHSRDDVVVWCEILAATWLRRSRDHGISAMLRSHVGRPVLGLALLPVVPCSPLCSRCVRTARVNQCNQAHRRRNPNAESHGGSGHLLVRCSKSSNGREYLPHRKGIQRA